MEREALAQRQNSLQSRPRRLHSVRSNGKRQIGFGSVRCTAAVRARGCHSADRTRRVKQAGVLVPMEMEPRLAFCSHLAELPHRIPETRGDAERPAGLCRGPRSSPAHPLMRSPARPGAPAASESPRVWPSAHGAFWTIYGRNTDLIKFSFQTGSGH